MNPVTQKEVSHGAYGFLFGESMFLEVVPSGGKPGVLRRTARTLESAKTEPIDKVIAVTDLDVLDSTPTPEQVQQRHREVTAAIQTTLTSPDFEARHFFWWAAGNFPSGVPAKQTLERLVCAAVCAAYPQRGECVQAWLQARPSGSPDSPKSYSWSYLAGWYPDHGCEHFLRFIWADPAIRSALERLLRECGAFQILEELQTQ